jgi:hypothetical protein
MGIYELSHVAVTVKEKIFGEEDGKFLEVN